LFFSRKRYDLTFLDRKQSALLLDIPFLILHTFDFESRSHAASLSPAKDPSDISPPTDLLSTLDLPSQEAHNFFKMDQIQTHPSNAAQAKTFIAPGSLSFPGGAGELTPPSSEADKQNGQRNGQVSGGQQQAAQGQNGNGVTPATPAATPGATQGVSGIVPTLQYVYPLAPQS